MTLVQFQIKLFWLLKTKVFTGFTTFISEENYNERFADCNLSASSAETYETNSSHQT